MEVDIPLVVSFPNGNALAFPCKEGVEAVPENDAVNIEVIEARIPSLVDRIHKDRFLRCVQGSFRPDIKRISLFGNDQIGADIEICYTVGLGTLQGTHRQRSRLGLHIGWRVILNSRFRYRVLNRRTACVIFRHIFERSGPALCRSQVDAGNNCLTVHQADRYLFRALCVVAFVIPRFGDGNIDRYRRRGRRCRCRRWSRFPLGRCNSTKPESKAKR